MKIKQKNTIDMTHGTLWNKLLIFALPLAASSILQQLFNSVDTAVVGRFASSRALAAVGSNSSLIALMINLFIGISLGSNVIISRYIGQKAEEHVKRQFTPPSLSLYAAAFSCLYWGSSLPDRY